MPRLAPLALFAFFVAALIFFGVAMRKHDDATAPPAEPRVLYSPEARAALDQEVEIAPMKRRLVFTSDECPNCESMRGQGAELAELVRASREELKQLRASRHRDLLVTWLDAATGESTAEDVDGFGKLFLEGGETDYAALRAMHPQHVIDVLRRARAWWSERHKRLAAVEFDTNLSAEARRSALATVREEANAHRQTLAAEFHRFGLPPAIHQRFLDL